MRKSFWLNLLASFFLISAFSACELKEPAIVSATSGREPFQFFVAGHAYGNPDSAMDYAGVYPDFYDWWPWLSAEKMAFGAFAGDVVPWNVPERWDSLEKDLNQLPFPKHLVPGNHDLTIGLMYDEFDRRFGPRYHSFRHQKDLFLFVDTETYHWRIPEAQLIWIEDEIANARDALNIFIITHNVIWWQDNPDSTFYFPTPNSLWNRGNPNFWEDLAPQLMQLRQNVYCFAGDTGRNCNGRELTYWNEGNLHLITTGMGCPSASNFLVVKVDEKGNTKIEPHWLNNANGGSIEAHRY